MIMLTIQYRTANCRKYNAIHSMVFLRKRDVGPASRIIQKSVWCNDTIYAESKSNHIQSMDCWLEWHLFNEIKKKKVTQENLYHTMIDQFQCHTTFIKKSRQGIYEIRCRRTEIKQEQNDRSNTWIDKTPLWQLWNEKVYFEREM